MNFELTLPVRVIFGTGRVKELGEIVRKYGDKVLVITGRNSARESGNLERITNIIDKSGLKYRIFNRISPNPLSDEVDEALSILKSEGDYKAIIGLGGGSVLDASKAISASMGYNSVRELIGASAIDSNPNSLPVITIPTTAGTGAEVTRGAIITDTQRGLKSGVRGNAVFPKVAIVDPELTYSMPQEVTRITGFDAFTHALETYISTSSNPFTDAIALESLRYIAVNLPRVLKEGSDFDAREKMSLASLMAGINIINTGTCLPHRMQQAMGSVVEMPHALGTAMLYPSWLPRVYPYAKEKLDNISRILEPSNAPSYESVVRFMDRIGMRPRLSDFAKPDQVPSFVSLVTGNLAFDPIPNIDKKMIKKIYEESFR